MDSGRYPSLSRFIEELDALAEGSEQESPDEGTADRGDTVRIQTIHGSKGLEAPIVFLTDTARADARTPANEVLIDWPPGESAPRHVSIYAAKKSWGSARLALFEQDALLRAKEDEHLLYVGMTRAKEILVVSGVLPARGEGESSWYARCAPFAELLSGPDGDGLDSDAEGLEGGTMSTPKGSEEIFIAAFQPAPQALGSHQVRPTVAAASEEADRARLFGIALHRVLEALAGQPPDPHRALALARAQRLDPNGRSANDLARLAVAILSEPSLKPFFDPSACLRAHNEVEILTAEGRVVRIDRLVEFHNETWILDYKSAQSAGGIDPHRAQLELYRTVVQGLRPDVRVRAGVIFADAVLIEI
jgi:ATP-dependent helicase/nuclease subunit A